MTSYLVPITTPLSIAGDLVWRRSSNSALRCGHRVTHTEHLCFHLIPISSSYFISPMMD